MSEEKKQVTVWLEKELYDKLKKLSKKNFTTITGMIKILVKKESN